MPRYDELGPQGFQDLVRSWNGNGQAAYDYASQYGYTAAQMADFYNQGISDPSQRISYDDAVSLMGGDPGLKTGSTQTIYDGNTTQAFDTNAYLTNLASYLNKTGFTGYGVDDPGQWNVYNLAQKMQDLNIDPYEHYQSYGMDNGVTSVVEPPQLYNPDLYPTSRTGLDQSYIDQIMTAVVPTLTNSLEDYPGQVDTLMNNSVDLSRSTTKDMLDGTLQSLLNDLNGRGIMDSSMSRDIIGNATGDVLKNYSNQNMQAGMEAAKLKLGIPALSGQLAQLGNISYQEDPSVPQQLLTSLYVGM